MHGTVHQYIRANHMSMYTLSKFTKSKLLFQYDMELHSIYSTMSFFILLLEIFILPIPLFILFF